MGILAEQQQELAEQMVEAAELATRNLMATTLEEARIVKALLDSLALRSASLRKRAEELSAYGKQP